MKTYNVNELIELMKEKRVKIAGFMKDEITQENLTSRVKKIITIETGAEQIIEKGKGYIDPINFFAEIFNHSNIHAEIKTTIQKYNAEKVVKMLARREACRVKIQLITQAMSIIRKNEVHKVDPYYADKEGRLIQNMELHEVPIFTPKQLNTLKDTIAAEERSLNTAIQKSNLEASLTI